MNSPAPADDLIKSIAGGLAGRLRSLVTMLDRLDRLESGSGAWRHTFEHNELPEAATELTLRALRTVANPNHFALLQVLAGSDSRSMAQLIESTGFGRLALTEQLNDLVQVGLAARLIDTDHAQITAAGASMVRLVETLGAEVVTQYQSS